MTAVVMELEPSEKSHPGNFQQYLVDEEGLAVLVLLIFLLHKAAMECPFSLSFRVQSIFSPLNRYRLIAKNVSYFVLY